MKWHDDDTPPPEDRAEAKEAARLENALCLALALVGLALLLC